MKPSEKKKVCDLISLVADAVATGTIPEAQDYLQERWDDSTDEIVSHVFDVLTKVYNKQTTTI